MGNRRSIIEKISNLKNGESCCFNMFEEGGASCYRCNDMFLLFEIPAYGGKEQYEDTYSESQIAVLVNVALGWT